jgi:L-malate glycosyltransferase
VKVLVCPHDLQIGGSQINAIDLAAEVAEHGHEAVVYAVDGPLRERIERLGLPFVPANPLHYRPGPTRIPQVHRLVRREGIDLIHAYEWPPALDAFFGAQLPLGTPVVCTVLSMAVSPLVPVSMPLIMGTDQLGEEARQAGHAEVSVLEPPIDVAGDNPETDGRPWRRELGIGDDELVVVSVSRLSVDLKLDALVDAIDAARQLADQHPVRFVLVGSGNAEGQLHQRAADVNATVGREVVLLPGSLDDPRPAYAGADIVIGMGSSILRGMAHARPVVVQGERGWTLPCTAETLPTFLWQGFWGVGEGRSAATALAGQLDELLRHPQRRADLGAWGRQVVCDRFSLASAAKTLARVYDSVVAAPRPSRRDLARDALSCGGRAVALEIQLHLPSNKRQARDETTARLSEAARPKPGDAT